MIRKGGLITERLLDLHEREAQGAPADVLARAARENKQIKKIVWDRQGGYPERAWGYVQWSIRPYEQRYGCDGTTDPNIHLIALRLCEQLGLDYPSLYEKAYEWQDEKPDESWLRFFNWAPIEQETIIPEFSEQALRNCLHDLSDINNRSVVAVLAEEFTRLGYHIDDWWED